MKYINHLSFIKDIFEVPFIISPYSIGHEWQCLIQFIELSIIYKKDN